MTVEEIDKVQPPCLLQHRATGLVVMIEHISGHDGEGRVRYTRTVEHSVGEYNFHWNMLHFDLMDNNELYED